jgi:hypothetical protein
MTILFLPPPLDAVSNINIAEHPDVLHLLVTWLAGWAWMTLVLLFVVMLLTRARPPGSTAPGLRRLTAPSYFAPWAWLVLFAAMTAVISVMPAHNRAIPAVHDHPFLQPLFVRILSPYGSLAVLCALALALLSPLVVTGDVLWRIARRESVRSWAPTLAVYAIGLALMGALILGNAFGLWLQFYMWFMD